MLQIAYVVTWRWSDGSGSGATAVFMDKARAEVLIKVLTADTASRDYKIEAVPFDAAPPAPSGESSKGGTHE
jgi:hypothetical protein